MRNCIILLAACVSACTHGTLSSELASSKAPLYDAFQAFCVATNAEPSVVKKVLVERGTRVQLEEPVIPTMKTQYSDVIVGGHEMRVAATTTTLPATKINAPITVTGCAVHSSVQEDESIEAIRRWVGVSRSMSSSPGYTESYLFDDLHGKHVPWADGELEHITTDHWRVMIITFDIKAPFVELTHFTPQLN